jgi:molybdopterin-guanine dinucleotide biosynthesis protein A
MISEEKLQDQPVDNLPSATITRKRFAAALMAGGKSSRMGTDKALLTVKWRGAEIPLWKRQLTILEALEPDQLIFSGHQRPGLPLVSVPDRWADSGPLAGIATCLDSCLFDYLLVLAVDLPLMESAFLKLLLLHSNDSKGTVPIKEGRYEPLVAVYPKQAFAVAVARIERSDLKLQDFVRQLVSLGLVGSLLVSPEMNGLFSNWNSAGFCGLD